MNTAAKPIFLLERVNSSSTSSWTDTSRAAGRLVGGSPGSAAGRGPAPGRRADAGPRRAPGGSRSARSGVSITASSSLGHPSATRRRVPDPVQVQGSRTLRPRHPRVQRGGRVLVYERQVAALRRAAGRARLRQVDAVDHDEPPLTGTSPAAARPSVVSPSRTPRPGRAPLPDATPRFTPRTASKGRPAVVRGAGDETSSKASAAPARGSSEIVPVEGGADPSGRRSTESSRVRRVGVLRSGEQGSVVACSTTSPVRNTTTRVGQVSDDSHVAVISSMRCRVARALAAAGRGSPPARSRRVAVVGSSASSRSGW